MGQCQQTRQTYIQDHQVVEINGPMIKNSGQDGGQLAELKNQLEKKIHEIKQEVNSITNKSTETQRQFHMQEAERKNKLVLELMKKKNEEQKEKERLSIEAQIPISEKELNQILSLDLTITTIRRLAFKAQLQGEFRKNLFQHIHDSKTSDGQESIKRASNSITILNCARINFQGMDLRGIKICGAFLNEANLQGCHFQGSNLSGVDFRQAELAEANLSNCNLLGAIFEDWQLFLTSRENLLMNSSRDAKLIAYFEHNFLQVSNIQNGKRQQIGKNSLKQIDYFSFSTNNKVIMVSELSGIKSFYCVNKGKKIFQLPNQHRIGYENGSLQWSEDGSKIALCHNTTNKRQIILYNFISKKYLKVIDGSSIHQTQFKVLFSPDNKHLATYDGGKICVWNIVNSKIISTLVEESEAVCCIDYSSDNKMIAYGVVLKIYLFFR